MEILATFCDKTVYRKDSKVFLSWMGLNPSATGHLFYTDEISEEKAAELVRDWPKTLE